MKHVVNRIRETARELFLRASCALKGLRPEGDFVVRRGKKRRIIELAVTCVCVAVFVFSAVMLARYAADYFRARQASEELRNMYYEATPTPAPSPTDVPVMVTEAPPTEPTAATQAVMRDVLGAVPAPTVSPAPGERLRDVKYPDNPHSLISPRFAKIRQQNEDIVGWLKIEGILDEAVVQRDNTYYLDRDWRGYHNENGALFLEKTCGLITRPHTCMIFGHNMKTGMMFGRLRKYEDAAFYRKNAFVTFDSMYEDGRYVIFASAVVSLDAARPDYVDFAGLISPVISLRYASLRDLRECSDFNCPIDVQPQDQLLVLVTCVGDDTQRRIVAARRLRDGETEETLLPLVQQTTGR